MSYYINRFLDLKCAGDILDIVRPVKNLTKEISEAMSLALKIRDILNEEKEEFVLIDFAAGNGLVGVTSAFITNISHVYSIDKKLRKRSWEKVNNFNYILDNIHSESIVDFLDSISYPMIFVSCHPCNNLSERIIELYNQTSSARYLLLMPCCYKNKHIDLESNSNGYEQWCEKLEKKCKGTTSLKKDKFVQSPKNNIISAQKVNSEIKSVPYRNFLNSLGEEIWQSLSLDNPKSYSPSRELTLSEWNSLCEVVRENDLVVGLGNTEFGFKVILKIYNPPVTIGAPCELLLTISEDHFPYSVKEPTYNNRTDLFWQVINPLVLNKRNEELIDLYSLPRIRNREYYEY